MLGSVMPIHGVQNYIRLLPRVDYFMSTLHTLLKSISLRRAAQHCFWYLSPEWALSPVPIIGLNSFTMIQASHQGGTKNGDNSVLFTRKRIIDPLHFSKQNSNSNLISETGLLCKLWEEKAFPFCCTLQLV